MTTLLKTTLIAALALLPLAAQPAPGRGPQAEGRQQALQLTEAQRTSIRAIREKRRPDLTARRDAMLHARIDLRSALRDPATPETRLRVLYDKASAARFELLLTQRALRQEVRAVLTPEQQARAAEMRHEGRAGMRRRQPQGEDWMGR
jgi:Spy/CpxP family protein refolding chaperone